MLYMRIWRGVTLFIFTFIAIVSVFSFYNPIFGCRELDTTITSHCGENLGDYCRYNTDDVDMVVQDCGLNSTCGCPYLQRDTCGWTCFKTRYSNDSNGDCDCSSPSCFLPGTKISTPDGDKDIETLKPGDKVLSFDEQTGKAVENTVDQSIVSQRDEYYIIKTASGKEVKATAEHPFYTGEQESERVKGQETEKPQKKVEQIIDFIKNIPLYLRAGWRSTFNF